MQIAPPGLLVLACACTERSSILNCAAGGTGALAFLVKAGRAADGADGLVTVVTGGGADEGSGSAGGFAGYAAWEAGGARALWLGE